MYAKCLLINELHPPCVDGGLWRMLCLLLSTGICQYPPGGFGGANYCIRKKVIIIHHLTTKREDSIIRYGGLRSNDED